jgi:hypothetical protein
VVHYLEITQSFDGYQAYLRKLHLEKYGRAPLTAKLHKDPKTKHVPETWPEMVPRDKLLQQTFQRILESVKRKAAKRYGSRTSLIVEFEDTFIRSCADQDALHQFARSALLPVASNFAGLYLVSDQQRLAFPFIVRPASCQARERRPR